MTYEAVLYDVRDKIATITMNRPKKMNALDHALWRDLIDAFDEAEKDRAVRVIILKGSGRAFSSGWNMKESPYLSVPEGEERWGSGNAMRTMRGISGDYLKIFNTSKPTIAQVHGYCLAAGCYLAMLCDLAISADDATFGHPATAAGGVDSMPLWVWYLGARKAKELLMTRRFIDGPEAARIGLVNKSVPSDQLEQEVQSMAEDCAVAPWEDPTPGLHGMAALKEQINTDLEIMGLGALFTYHRQMNAWGHANLGNRGGNKDE